MKMRQDLKDAIQNILDTFSGADGGASFMFFRWLMEEMDRQAAEGDKEAELIVLHVKRFSKLIDVARKEFEKAGKRKP